jgi:hypothetical protein
MAISASAGTKIYIGPVANLTTLKALSEAAGLATFEAISEGSWIEVGETESIGEVGDQSNPITFASLADQRMLKLKGVRDAGTLQVTCARDGEDAGQLATEEAEKTQFNYRFRIRYNDAPDANYSSSTDYFAGQVMSRQVNIADVNAVTRRTFSVGVNTPVYTDYLDPTGS